MVDEGRPAAKDKKMFWFKVGAFVVALAAAGGVVFFLVKTVG
jgi:flagellar basal body-associated protein FliL